MILWSNLNPNFPMMKLTFANYAQRCGVESGEFFRFVVSR